MRRSKAPTRLFIVLVSLVCLPSVTENCTLFGVLQLTLVGHPELCCSQLCVYRNGTITPVPPGTLIRSDSKSTVCVDSRNSHLKAACAILGVAAM